ncbi:MAG: hypothetical protein NC338_00445 [Firmicutes bacterium]|nr:hypothetical protein [Bacillota bacterium]MCM1400589.1 hypothetical protein [Bacteroides sp.]MCM1477484.1 hypothetical protein [Bacteroides sp.]
MKQIIGLLLSIIALSFAHAEDYDPILKVGKKWIITYGNAMDTTTTWLRVTVDNKVTVKDKNYYHLTTTNKHEFYMYEENGCLYILNGHGSGSETDLEAAGLVPILDMSLNVGDIYPKLYSDSFYECGEKQVIRFENAYSKIIKTDYCDIRGSTRKCCWIQREYCDRVDGEIWVEGIGGLSEQAWMICFMYANTCCFKIVQCWDGDELIFAEDDFDHLVAGLESIDADCTLNDSCPTYNLQGIPVSHPQRGEIYIRNGQKFIQP